MIKIKKRFPSPHGVIFSLIVIVMAFNDIKTDDSFRLLTELYSLLSLGKKVDDVKTETFVSVSSRSYILSYLF